MKFTPNEIKLLVGALRRSADEYAEQTEDAASVHVRFEFRRNAREARRLADLIEASLGDTDEGASAPSGGSI